MNGDKQDNRAENLEWASNSTNQIHAYKLGLNTGARGKGITVGVTFPNGDYKEYASLKFAGKDLGIHARTVRQKILGLQPSIKLIGYKFTLIKARRYTDRALYENYGITETRK